MVPINYLAVLACGIVAMILGTLWYGPLFGKPWMKLMGFTPPTPAEKKAMGPSMMKTYGIMFVGSLIMAFVLAHSLVFAATYTNQAGIAGGLMAGFWSWLGFIAPVTMGPQLWEKKPWSLYLINAGYYLVDLLIMGVILALWI